jgi:protein-tyrosine phosphatase
MQAEMYEITPCPQGRLAIMPRPRGAEWLHAELLSLKNRGVTDIVSMLTPLEEKDLGLLAEAETCAKLGITFHRHPIKDRGVPVEPAFDAFISSLLPILARGGFIAAHCRGGIGRSGVLSAALLNRLSVPAEEAILQISNARGFEIPDTDEQYEFIFAYALRHQSAAE